MNTTTGKAGTLAPADFDSLANYSNSFGPKLLAQKVAKICIKRSQGYLHEYPTSAVGTAYKTVADKINAVTGTSTKAVSNECFNAIGKLVERYGAELLVQKLGKIAARQAKEFNSPELKVTSDSLKGIFPR